ALLHGRHEPVVQVQVRPTNASARYAHDRVTRVQNLRVRNSLYAHLFSTHPTNCLHAVLQFSCPATAVSLCTGLDGFTRCIASPMLDRGPCDCPSVVGISPVSISALKRRRF